MLKASQSCFTKKKVSSVNKIAGCVFCVFPGFHVHPIFQGLKIFMTGQKFSSHEEANEDFLVNLEPVI
jgi:hypothetical protein